MPSPLIIAILDRSEIHSDLKEYYSKLLLPLNYDYNFLLFTEQSQLLEHLRKAVIHIVICDLSLGDTQNMRGLNLIQKIKQEWPQIICIGNTRNAVNYRQTLSKMPTFDLFIDKAKLYACDDVFYEQIRTKLEQEFKINVFVKVSSQSRFLNLIKDKEDLDLQYIIGQISFTGHPNTDMVKIDEIKLTPLTGGRSGSDVYKIEAFSSDSMVHTVPAVLKISPKNKADIEIENYNRFVKWTLPYTWRVDLLGTGFTKKLGGICYSFILGGSHPFDSFTYYIENANDDVINAVIKQVFSPKMKTWYNSVEKEDNINMRYSNRYFWDTSMNCESAKFIDVTQKYFNGFIQSNSVLINDYTFPLPVDDLFAEPHGNYHSCICHGDLNSNNIIASINNDFIFIDFQDTGRGHVFEDFVTLEASIRMNYPIDSNIDLLDILRNEMELTATGKINNPCSDLYKHIISIRNLYLLLS